MGSGPPGWVRPVRALNAAAFKAAKRLLMVEWMPDKFSKRGLAAIAAAYAAPNVSTEAADRWRDSWLLLLGLPNAVHKHMMDEAGDDVRPAPEVGLHLQHPRQARGRVDEPLRAGKQVARRLGAAVPHR